MFLLAHSIGLGCCWIGCREELDRDNQAREFLGVPENFRIVAPPVFGYPKENKNSIPKRSYKLLKWIK